jgi:hypothetical protein
MRIGNFLFWITFFAILIQSVFIFHTSEDFLAIPMVLAVALIVPLLIRRFSKSADVEFQIDIFLLALAMRLWVSLLLYSYGFSELIGDEDASGFATGWVRAQDWYITGIDGFLNDLASVFVEKQNVGQSVIWGVIAYIAGGPARLAISFFHCFVGSALVLVGYRLAKEYVSENIARSVAYFITFWASLLIFSAGTSKEILVIGIEWTLIMLAMRNPQGISIRDLFFAVPLFLVLYTIRFYAFYAVIAAYFMRAITGNRKNFVRNAFAGLILVIGLLVALESAGVITRDQVIYESRFEATNLQNWRRAAAGTAESGIVLDEDIEQGWLSIPVKTAYFFFSPFPWEIGQGTLRRQLAIIETVFLIVIFVAGFAGIKKLFAEKFFDLIPPLTFSIVYSGVHIITLTNSGLAWRHRQTIMPLIFIFAATGLAAARKRRSYGSLRVTPKRLPVA